jgi:catechol 2,3-dioxygenase-like lactoylglutathione lyase family enzyme
VRGFVDHISLGVTDLARSKQFYDAALAPLGFVPTIEIAGEVKYAHRDCTDRNDFALYIGFEDPNARRAVVPSAGFHVAFQADSRDVVDQFHAVAVAAGGRDNGAPGLRPRYHADYYGAFVLDPDGHHIEAVCHAPA